MRRSAAPFHADHSWLAAAVPAAASRFRVLDADIAGTLQAAGARPVEHDPDVEIGTPEELSGEAPVAIANLDASPPEYQARLSHAARRIAASAAVRVRAERARRELRRRGYRHIAVLPWDRGQVVRLPGVPGPARLAPAERFPCRVVVVGSRRGRSESAFDRAVSEAGELIGRRLQPGWPRAGAGGLVALCDGAVLRVAIGPARHQIRAQADALRALAAVAPPDTVTARVPRVLAEGGFGATCWSLEMRLAGRPAPYSLDNSVVRSGIGFLEALHWLGEDRDVDVLAVPGKIIEAFLPADRRPVLQELVRRTEVRIAKLPRVFGHGDFCSTNLLVEDGRITGVVDWEAASRSSLPLLDLLHLHLVATSHADVYRWGPAILDQLLPLVRRRDDAVIGGYLRQVELDPDPATLEALLAAYWLERASYHLGTYVERARDDVWLERNVLRVLDGLTGGAVG